ncbi:endonuclease/exonuclease/phosphatase family protein [Verrucomicrobiaceae bacterium N1E253]|uniref:Endonuclease/exonuclease/phosphatase family protein n=1 Tax=Oceaniferula marina TaxID=2748318 RepID=A0A851GFI6_9BACT|nr:endonuclease/exonuclease/phosphatase family protein [Oceaniferula marina]NWK55969.1 endonuclease/exonuclease/phosphatase family protein [Oceaniferula marina]
MMNPAFHSCLKILCASLTLILTINLRAAEPDPHPETLRVMSYNTWYVFAKGKAIEAGGKWIHSQTPDVVALQELTNIKPEKLEQLAASWGHNHSSLLKTSGFSVGLTSRWPIKVIEKGQKGMHHGFLHAKTHGVHYFVVHLSPFKWEVRQREANILTKKITPLLKQGERIIVLGDFNAYSPEDQPWLEPADNTQTLEKKKQDDAQHAHMQNLKDGAFDYAVLNTFLSSGLTDTAKGHLPEKAESRLSFPTGILTDKQSAVTSGERIDFILASGNLYSKVQSCRIITDGVVNQISDHYPVITDFSTD